MFSRGWVELVKTSHRTFFFGLPGNWSRDIRCSEQVCDSYKLRRLTETKCIYNIALYKFNFVRLPHKLHTHTNLPLSPSCFPLASVIILRCFYRRLSGREPKWALMLEDTNDFVTMRGISPSLYLCSTFSEKFLAHFQLFHPILCPLHVGVYHCILACCEAISSQNGWIEKDIKKKKHQAFLLI